MKLKRRYFESEVVFSIPKDHFTEYKIVDLCGAEIYSQALQAIDAEIRILTDQLPMGKQYEVIFSGAGKNTQIEKFIAPLKKKDIQWITGKELPGGSEYYSDNNNLILMKSFTIDFPVKEASFLGSALGFYELRLNGKKVDFSELNSKWTNYREVIYYDMVDVTEYLRVGENEIQLELGNGWYNPAPLKMFGKYNLRDHLPTGNPAAFCKLFISDGSKSQLVESDESWDYLEGQYLFNNVYLGERVDLLHEEKSLKKVRPHTPPTDRLIPHFIPYVKSIAKQKPESIIQKQPKKLLIAFPKNYEGFFEIAFHASAGDRIEIVYGEELNPDGSISTESNIAGAVKPLFGGKYKIDGGPGAPEKAEQRDSIICKDGVNKFKNKFTYHSYKYVEIEGLEKEQIIDCYSHLVANDQEENVEFLSSESFLNELFQAVKLTKMNNTHDTFEDCARERFGYGGDMVNLMKTQLYLFESKDILEKILIDFRHDMDPSGAIPETAPYVGIGSFGTGGKGGPLGWQLVYPYGLKNLMAFYGDTGFVLSELPYAKKHIAFLLDADLDAVKDWCLGDWASIDAEVVEYRRTSPDKEFTTYCIYLLTLRLYKEILEDLRQDQDLQSELENRITMTKDFINQKFKNDDDSYGTKSQTSYAYAAFSGLVDNKEKFAELLSDKIAQEDGKLHTGIFGSFFIYEILGEYGFNKQMLEWLLKDGNYTFKDMLSKGTGTLFEHLYEENEAKNHAMFGSYLGWLIEKVLGIEIDGNAKGNKIILNAPFDSELSYCMGSYTTEQGRLSVHWSREASGGIKYEATIDSGIDEVIIKIEKEKEILSNQAAFIEIEADGKYAYYLLDERGKIDFLIR